MTKVADDVTYEVFCYCNINCLINIELLQESHRFWNPEYGKEHCTILEEHQINEYISVQT